MDIAGIAGAVVAGLIVLAIAAIVGSAWKLRNRLPRYRLRFPLYYSQPASQNARTDPEESGNSGQRIEFYASRPELSKLRGTLEDELKSVRHGWASWTAFQSAPQIDARLLRNVERMVLRDPNSPDLETIANLSGVSLNQLAESIRTASSIAQGQGVEVKWSPHNIPDLIISDPHGVNGWIRIEAWIPRMHARNRPSFIVRRSETNDLFEAILAAFEEIWTSLPSPNNSTPASVTQR